MEEASQHRYFILTKRPKRLAFHIHSYFIGGYVPDNIFLGVSIEKQKYVDERINSIANCHAKRFISVEPILEPINLSHWINHLDWVIVGDESRAGDCFWLRSATDINWVRSIRDQCIKVNVPFFFKQWHRLGYGKVPVPELDGKRWNQMPEETL